MKPWADRRADMWQACQSCHAKGWVDNWYLYNDKFGSPATKLFQMTRAAGLITNDIEFDDQLEFTYYFLWHHEGRRARHGVAMMGPDYTRWHGNYEVAHRFYMEFVPQLQEVLKRGAESGDPRKAAAAKTVGVELEKVLNSELHRWFLGEMTLAERAARKKAADEFKKRYAQ